MGGALKLILVALLPAALMAGEHGAEPSAPATSSDMVAIQTYTFELGKVWLKDLFSLDVESIRSTIRETTKTYSQLELGTVPRLAPGLIDQRPVHSLSLRLEQIDDIRRLAKDTRDIPFALRMESDSSLGPAWFRLSTSLYLPFTWRDEIRAKASLPLVPPGLGNSAFFSGLTLNQGYSNRLGVSSIQTGLGTKWLDVWTLDLDLEVRYGQDSKEYSRWLKLGRTF